MDRVALGALICLYPLFLLIPIAIRTADPHFAVQGNFRQKSGGFDQIDPWGRPIVAKELSEVVPAGTKVVLTPTHYAYEVYSLGPDGVDAGGAGDDVLLVGKGKPLYSSQQFARARLLAYIVPTCLIWFPILFLLPSYLWGRFVLRSRTPIALGLLVAGSAGAAASVAIPMTDVYLEAIPQSSVLNPRLSLGLAVAVFALGPGAVAHFFHREGGPGWREEEPEEEEPALRAEGQ